MLTVSWFYCRWLLGRFAVPALFTERLLMGVVAFTLLMVAEILLGMRLFGRTLTGQVTNMTSGPGLAGLRGQLVFATLPLPQQRGAAS